MSAVFSLVFLLALVWAAVATQKRGFRRLAGDKVIGGVCSGIARQTNISVTAVRIIAVILLLFTGGITFFAYVFAWLIWPLE